MLDLALTVVTRLVASLAPAPAAPVCIAAWPPSVHDSLERCLGGEGDGCAEVGRDYRERACDAFASIKWYELGCRLGSARACAALK